MATKTTPTSPKAWAPDQTAFVPGDVVPDALILNTANVVGQIEGDEPAIRVPFVADDGVVGFVAEGAEIPDANQSFDEVVVLTGKVAALGKYSFETLAQPEAARMVVDSLSRSVVTKANAAYLGNLEAGPGPVGLLNTPDIIEAGPLGANLDLITDVISFIENDGGTATHIIANPLAWATLSKLKRATDSNESLVGAGTEAGERRLLSLPVLVDAAMPAGSLLVVDQSAIIGAQSPVRLARSEDAYFSSDAIGVRVTWRCGWKVMHASRVAKLTIATAP
jgi:HK97 family phage major capsid protein